jgi:hypothetical protein
MDKAEELEDAWLLRGTKAAGLKADAEAVSKAETTAAVNLMVGMICIVPMCTKK